MATGRLKSLSSALLRMAPQSTRSWLRYWGRLALEPRFDEAELVWSALRSRGVPQIMVDVGAHEGSSLRPFADDGWRVYAFEPDPDNRRKLEANVAEYGIVEIDSRAVSDEPATGIPFYASKLSSGISGLAAFHESHAQRCTVDATTLADFIRERGIDHIGFLKIDAEGHDFSVLRGHDWQYVRPAVVTCEFEDQRTRKLGYTMRDLIELLESHGYHVAASEWYPITEYGGCHRWRVLHGDASEVGDGGAWGNLIAARDAALFAHVMATARTYVRRFNLRRGSIAT